MLDRIEFGPEVLLDAKAATGWGTELDVRRFKNITLVLSTASSFSGTVKIATSILGPGAVDFTSGAAVGNEWDYAYCYNLQTAVGTPGDTGVVYTGTDAVEQLVVNVERMGTLNVQVSARAAGAVTVKALCTDNS